MGNRGVALKKNGASGQRLWTWKFMVLILINLSNGVASFMTVPLVASYAMTLGAELTTASTVAGILSLVSLIMCPAAGVLSDKVDRKKLLLITEVGYAAALALHVAAPNIPALMVVRGLTGVFFSIANVLTVAYASSFIPRSKMGEGLGYFSLVSPLAQALGPVLGLALRDSMGYHMAFWGGAAATVVALVCVAVLPYTEEKKEAAGKQHSLRLKDVFAVEFLCLMLLTALFSSANGLVSTYLDIIAGERSIGNISLFFTVYSVVLVASKPFTGKLLDKKGLSIIVIPAVIFAALGMALVGLASSLGLMLAAAVCKALGQGAGTPSIQAYTVKTLEPARAGVAVSTIQIGQNLGNALAPIGGSFFAESFGYEAMFCGVGLFTLIAGMLLLVWHARKSHVQLVGENCR